MSILRLRLNLAISAKKWKQIDFAYKTLNIFLPLISNKLSNTYIKEIFIDNV